MVIQRKSIYSKNKTTYSVKRVVCVVLAVLLSLNLSLTSFTYGSSDSQTKSDYSSIDLFEGNNLNETLKNSLKKVMKTDYRNRFINEKFQSIENMSEELRGTIGELISYLERIDAPTEDSQIHVIKTLTSIQNYFCSDKDVKNQDLFVQYIYGMKKAYQVEIAQATAQKIFEQYIAISEETLDRVAKSSHAQAGVSLETPAIVQIGASLSSETSSGMTDTSFYTISIGGSAKLDVELEVLKLFSLKFGLGASITKTSIFYCIEEMLDSQKFDLLKLTSSSVKQIANSRNTMQKHEKELVAIFNSYIASFLKSMEIVPQNVDLKWPDITRNIQSETSTSVSKSIGASASVALDSFGAGIKGTHTSKLYKKQIECISLIEDDCSVIDGLESEDLISLLGSEYNVVDNEVFQYPDYAISYILGEIRFYNSIISSISAGSEDKDLKKSKKTFEDRWLTQKGCKTLGRNSVLKSMIIAGAKLREAVSEPSDIERLKYLYSEIKKLSQLQKAFKDKSSGDPTFTLSTVASNYSCDGDVKLTVPKVGEVKINVTRIKLKNNPFQQENGDYAQVRLTVPTSIAGVAALKAIKEELNSKTKVRKDDVLLISSEALAAMIENFSSLEISEESNSTTFSIMMIRISPQDNSLEIPLPGASKIYTKTKNEWAAQYFQIMANFGIDEEKDFGFFNASVTAGAGFRGRVIGYNTLTYISARYNALALGFKSSGREENTAWNLFKSKQSAGLEKLFITLNNTKSNAYYELQLIYNIVNSNIDDEDEILTCERTFKNFLNCCKKMKGFKDINKDEYNQAKESAFRYFDEVMRFSHKYNFMVFYNQSYSTNAIQ